MISAFGLTETVEGLLVVVPDAFVTLTVYTPESGVVLSVVLALEIVSDEAVLPDSDVVPLYH
jgi:hypothetical protein